ncbi:hypothetical protein BLNAU_13779 [Blattamonas nauphoetae]|uniref:Uncharacterized protein n=1 Tax=Blattamonas nauphoetae TaxID=2049346 RepID=A0ABQ9XFP7_9EUKA|nr:hypothetical protein BLNAU_13779 [Blattamonas nauphoetae]
MLSSSVLLFSSSFDFFVFFSLPFFSGLPLPLFFLHPHAFFYSHCLFSLFIFFFSSSSFLFCSPDLFFLSSHLLFDLSDPSFFFFLHSSSTFVFLSFSVFINPLLSLLLFLHQSNLVLLKLSNNLVELSVTFFSQNELLSPPSFFVILLRCFNFTKFLLFFHSPLLLFKSSSLGFLPGSFLFDCTLENAFLSLSLLGHKQFFFNHHFFLLRNELSKLRLFLTKDFLSQRNGLIELSVLLFGFLLKLRHRFNVCLLLKGKCFLLCSFFVNSRLFQVDLFQMFFFISNCCFNDRFFVFCFLFEFLHSFHNFLFQF